ncbi:helix-turn-helix domain-containing protein [Nocardia salmonicida]|uniref:MmyB family transcriptional regulator n=1 Tax=Nocardia salmonicida TaxID=53431 RepID=UPI0033DDFE88
MLPLIAQADQGLGSVESASLAGMSTDYYTRLEQARGPRPSTQVLAALARALRLSADERDHLFHLCGHQSPDRGLRDKHVGPGLLHMLDKLDDVPAAVITDLGEVLVQNRMHSLLAGDHSTRRGLDRFYSWRWFTDPSARTLFPESDWSRMSRSHVADLRATAARRADDAEVVDFISRLRADSTEFEQLWNEHEVAVRISDTKQFLHPEIGLIDTICETLLTPNAAQRLLVYLPRPGTDAAEKMALLRVIGTQLLSPTP